MLDVVGVLWMWGGTGGGYPAPSPISWGAAELSMAHAWHTRGRGAVRECVHRGARVCVCACLGCTCASRALHTGAWKRR